MRKQSINYRMHFFFTLSFLLMMYGPSLDAAVVINSVNGGRLGDKLLTFVRAYWVAWKHGIDLAVRWFPYADHFKLWTERAVTHHINHILSGLNKVEDVEVDKLILYEVGLYFCQPEWKYPHDVTSWVGLIDNKEFIKDLRKKITPSVPLVLAPLPSKCLRVALHLRRGGGYDAPLLSDSAKLVESCIEESLLDQTEQECIENIPCEAVESLPLRSIPRERHRGYRPRLVSRHNKKPVHARPRPRPRPNHYADRGDPLKFPPLSFYVDALYLLIEECKGAPLYVYIFTDDKKPLVLQRYFEKQFKEYDIVFDCRVSGNSHDQNVLADMFDMARYDYLIRPDSSYSKVAQLIGSYKMVLYAHEARWYNNVLKITKIMKARNNRMVWVAR